MDKRDSESQIERKGKTMNLRKWSFILAATLIVAQATADIVPQDHVAVETRPLTHAQKMQIVEERAAEPAPSGFTLDKQTSVGNFNVSTSYTSIHPGAYHWAVDISAYGEQISTEDGSIWTTFPGDRYKVVGWSSLDDIVVIQNTDPFSNYLFILVNVPKNQKCYVNLVLGPMYSGAYTYWIKAINVSDRKVVLNDNSVWDLSRFDSSVYRMWFVNDTIIIGVNDGSLNSFNPNILINVNTLTYSRASLD